MDHLCSPPVNPCSVVCVRVLFSRCHQRCWHHLFAVRTMAAHQSLILNSLIVPVRVESSSDVFWLEREGSLSSGSSPGATTHRLDTRTHCPIVSNCYRWCHESRSLTTSLPLRVDMYMSLTGAWQDVNIAFANKGAQLWGCHSTIQGCKRESVAHELFQDE